jgi:polar amino acid transport system substrate-binding protein
MFRKFLASLFVLFAPATHALGTEPLLLLYNTRAPYMSPAADGGVTGLTADVAAYALRRARVPFKWVEVPSARQVFMIKENQIEVAGLGWYKNPERETFAKFSTALYQDKQIVVLARKDNPKFASIRTVEQLLSDRELTLLAKVGYSYGQFLDGQIAKLRPKTIAVTVENLNMIQMIDARRADYMFISPEEASVAIPLTGVRSADLQLLTPGDMPRGEKRYLMFSRMVSDETIKLIDTYIDEYNASLR